MEAMPELINSQALHIFNLFMQTRWASTIGTLASHDCIGMNSFYGWHMIPVIRWVIKILCFRFASLHGCQIWKGLFPLFSTWDESQFCVLKPMNSLGRPHIFSLIFSRKLSIYSVSPEKKETHIRSQFSYRSHNKDQSATAWYCSQCNAI